METIIQPHGYYGVNTVWTSERIECHGPKYRILKDISGRGGSTSPRVKNKLKVLTFWRDMGIAHADAGGKHGRTWFARDIATGDWFPFLGDGDALDSTKHVTFSHIVSADNGGAWCACNLVPELGVTNEARGSADMTSSELLPYAHILDAWPAWFGESDYCGKAARARLCLA